MYLDTKRIKQEAKQIKVTSGFTEVANKTFLQGRCNPPQGTCHSNISVSFLLQEHRIVLAVSPA